MAKNALSGLTFATLELPKWSRDRDPISDRREKTVRNLEEQKALLADPTFKRVVEKRSGTTEKRVSKWWVTRPDGSVQFTVRYGWATVEFAPGKAAIVVPSIDKLPAVIDQLISAVKDGSLDSHLAAIANKQKEKIQKKPATTKKAA